MHAAKQLVDPLSPASPERIGRFAVLRTLGRGATSAVYLAHDPLIGRDVAIKQFDVRTGSSWAQRNASMLINEARAAGRLSHPGIVTVFEAGHETAGAYLVMEYLHGSSLAAMLRSGTRFSCNESALIIRRLAQALAHAHRHAVVHRDIKPANIFMVSRCRPKLLDFGIARAPNRVNGGGQPADGTYTLFRDNVLGTPAYMSPEQALARPADARTDVYSLGVVLYELLTGRTPFDSSNAEQLLLQISKGSPKAPHDIDPAIPKSLSQIAMKAMDRQLSKRYQGANEMLVDLKRYLVRHGRHRTGEGEAADRPAVSEHAPAEPAQAGPKARWQPSLWGLAAILFL